SSSSAAIESQSKAATRAVIEISELAMHAESSGRCCVAALKFPVRIAGAPRSAREPATQQRASFDSLAFTNVTARMSQHGAVAHELRHDPLLARARRSARVQRAHVGAAVVSVHEVEAFAAPALVLDPEPREPGPAFGVVVVEIHEERHDA